MKKFLNTEIEIYTDGACKGNPGLGGWGAYIKVTNIWHDKEKPEIFTYELYGGVLPEGAPTEYEEGCNTELLNPIRPGYTFLGWTVGSTGTDYVTAVPENITGPVKIYANWKID